MAISMKSGKILPNPHPLVYLQGDNVVSKEEMMINNKLMGGKPAKSDNLEELGKKSVVTEQASKQKVDNYLGHGKGKKMEAPL